MRSRLSACCRIAAGTAILAAPTILLSTVFPGAARADVVLSNFALPRTGNTTGINQLFVKAVGLTAPATGAYSFTSLQAPLRNQTTTDFTAIATIRADSGGNPGTILTTLSSVVLPGAGTGGTFVDYSFTGAFTFTAGQTYWFVLESDRPTSGQEVAWAEPGPSTAPTASSGFSYVGYRTGSVSGGSTIWTNSAVLNSVQINAVAVPEPGTLALLGVATTLPILGIVKRRRQQRK